MGGLSRNSYHRMLCCSAAVVCVAVATPAMAQTRTFDIPAQDASKGIPAFAKQAGIQLLASARDTRGKHTNAVRGNYSVAEALVILLRGTELEPVGNTSGPGIVTIRRRASTAVNSSPVGDADGAPPAREVATRHGDSQAINNDQAEGTVTDIIVTGSHIRAADILSPVIVINRQDIERSGFGQLDQLLNNLPQNFKGGAASDVNPNTAPGALNNQTYASGVNLRGLGTEATLVLLNGRRLAPTGLGKITDISLVPLAIVERVDALTDGASAIYGSDAIAGVVNIITRRNFRGLESAARYGLTDDGAKQDISAGQLIGIGWSSGNVTLSYDFRRQGSLSALDRSASKAAGDTDLMPHQDTHSAYLGLDQTIAPGLTLQIDGLASSKGYANRTTFSGVISDDSGRIKSGSLAAALSYDMGAWRLALTGDYGAEKDRQLINYTNFGIVHRNLDTYQVGVAELRVDGPIAQLPGGSLRIAAGAAYRDEGLSDLLVIKTSTARHSIAAFGELFVPLVSDSNRMPGVRKLSFSIAGRYEKYSDFGSTFNPKIALLWAPDRQVELTASFSTSFKAPSLFDLTEKGFSTGYVFDAPDPTSPTGKTRTLFLDGGNARLKEERARNLTFGAKIMPDALPGLSISFDTFSIRFKDRILRLFPDVNFAALLQADVYGDLITRAPSAQQIADAMANRTVFSRVGAYLPSSILAIADLRTQNVASSNANGVDLSVKYRFGSRKSMWLTEGDVTYLSDKQQITSLAAPAQVVGTTYNPPRWRARGQVAWASHSWGAMARINYTGPSEDSTDAGCFGPSGPCAVKAWTTVDFSLSYDTGSSDRALVRNLRISLDIQNLFDRDPPIANNAGGIGYDPTNANALKRYFSLQITKRW